MTKTALIDTLVGDMAEGSIWSQWIHSTFYGTFAEYAIKHFPELFTDCDEE